MGNTWACRANLLLPMYCNSCSPRMWRSWQRVPALFVVAERTDEKKTTSFWMATSSLPAQAFPRQKSRSNGDQRNPQHVSLNITKCDVDIRKDLSDNVVMHCHDPEIVERVMKELTALAPPTMF